MSSSSDPDQAARPPRAAVAGARVAGRWLVSKALRRRTLGLGQALAAGLRAFAPDPHRNALVANLAQIRRYHPRAALFVLGVAEVFADLAEHFAWPDNQALRTEIARTVPLYAGIEQLADIRTVPGSRRNPQYGQNELEKSLKKAGIDYLYIKKLGGLRGKPKGESANQGWRNASFRNYADYMQTEEFESGIDELKELAGKAPTVIMCAEAVPWRCHRSLVGDAMLVRDYTVRDVMSKTSAPEHKLTSFAKVDGSTITYPFDPNSSSKGN